MVEFLAVIFLAITIVSSFHPIKDTPKGEILVPAGTPSVQTDIHYKVKPFSVFNDENIIRQKYDYSCGSAALATILNYFMGEEISEKQVIKGLMMYGDRKQIESRRAFSLLDMKRFVSKIGYNVAGYTAEIDDLKSLGMPCIVPIDIYGYKHFVVFRGIFKNHVFVADPYLGNTSFSIEKFADIWYKNIVFLVTNSGNEIDALMLTDKDLRVVDFDMTERALNEFRSPRPFALDQQRLEESTGEIFYIHRR